LTLTKKTLLVSEIHQNNIISAYFQVTSSHIWIIQRNIKDNGIEDPTTKP